jgi:hypothetical protein
LIPHTHKSFPAGRGVAKGGLQLISSNRRASLHPA